MSFLYDVVLSAFCLNVGFEAQIFTVGALFTSVLEIFDKVLSCISYMSLLYLGTPTQTHTFSFSLIHSTALVLKGKSLLISSGFMFMLLFLMQWMHTGSDKLQNVTYFCDAKLQYQIFFL